ncbi:MAG: hypothetical protein D6729_19450 [Deltaproteobacteria bacterium]|nr:MAG: hypothetical protein D6729_19450 [Deltaproteobacteria bacterium]
MPMHSRSTAVRLALPCLLALRRAGCIHDRKPFRPGAVYQTLPQDRSYVELGAVRGSSWAWDDPVNAALREALAEAQAMGADGIVQAQMQEEYSFRWTRCRLLPSPALPCRGVRHCSALGGRSRLARGRRAPPGECAVMQHALTSPAGTSRSTGAGTGGSSFGLCRPLGSCDPRLTRPGARRRSASAMDGT